MTLSHQLTLPAVRSCARHADRGELQWADELDRGTIYSAPSLMSPHEQKTRDSLPSSSARRQKG